MTGVDRAVAIAAAAALTAPVLCGQGRGGQNWNTISADAQRTGWLRVETRISTATLAKPDAGGFQLLWKVKPENKPRELNTLTQPLILGNLISHKGFKALAFFGGSDDIVYAYDYDLGKEYWHQRLNTAVTPRAATSIMCPGGLTAISRPTPLLQSAMPDLTPPARGGGAGRGPAPAPPAPAGAGRGPQPQGGVMRASLPIFSAVWAISSGGMVHALNPHTGEDLRAPSRIVPAGANVVGSVHVNDTLYAATSGGCANTADGVWSLDVSGDASSSAKHWDAGGAAIAGSAGFAIGLNNLVYVATGGGTSRYASAVVALDSQTLQPRDSFTAPGRSPFTSTPVAFRYGGRDLVAAATRDGRLYLLDGAALGGADHGTALARSAVMSTLQDFSAGAVTTWQDPDDTRWLLVPTARAIVAYKVVAGESFALQPAWTSRELVSPAPAIVLNDVVFALSTGASRAPGGQMSAAERLQRSMPAVLYALDAKTGKELWSSGRTITASVQGVGPSGQDGQVYVVAADGTLYAFGIPLEH